MKKYFITGLVILLPIAITVAILVFVIDFLTHPFVGLVSSALAKYRLPPTLITFFSEIIILILLFFFITLLGAIARWFFNHALFKLGDRILRRIPIVNTVYKTSKDIINTIFAKDKNAFKQVAMVPFPSKESYVIGLVSQDAPQICNNATNSQLITVLVPTTPNPTTGFLMMFKKEEIILIDMRPEEAIKYVVSCGVIIPGTQNPPKIL